MSTDGKQRYGKIIKCYQYYGLRHLILMLIQRKETLNYYITISASDDHVAQPYWNVNYHPDMRVFIAAHGINNQDNLWQ